MRSTCNWLKRHRLATLTAGVALTALMLAPEAADAGRRWRSRRCCCGHYSGNAHYGGSGYHHGYAYNSGTWSGSQYAGQGYANSRSGYSYESGAVTDQNRRMAGDNEPQPQLAQNQQGDRIIANRPDLESSDAVPPAPGEASNNNNQRTFDSDNSTNRSTDNQNESAQVREMRQRIQSLEQENKRLKQQLEDARSNNRNDSANRAQETNDTESGVSADAEASTDLPKLPDAEGKTGTESN